MFGCSAYEKKGYDFAKKKELFQQKKKNKNDVDKQKVGNEKDQIASESHFANVRNSQKGARWKWEHFRQFMWNV